MRKIREVKDFELRAMYENLCDNEVLNDEYTIVVEKGLTHALGFMKVLKVEWINIVLSCIHDMKVWLEGGPIKINKAIIHQVTRYPTLDRLKIMKCVAINDVEKSAKTK